GHRGVYRVRCEVFRKLQLLPLSFHHKLPQGDAIQRLADDATGFHGILNHVVTLAASVATFVIMTAIMLSLSVKLTLLALAVVPPVLVTNAYFGRVFRRQCDVAKRSQTDLLVSVQRGMSTMPLVQAFGREGDELEGFCGRADRAARNWLRFHKEELHYTIA